MFEFIKRRRQETPVDATENHAEAARAAETIAQWEQRLANNPQDGEIQKQLMLEYNRALKIYAKSKRHRDQLDLLFVKIDELRNITRKTI